MILKRCKISFILILLFFIEIFPQGIVINEFMSSNYSVLKDEDGTTSDWIELYNKSEDTLNLDGYYLSDDKLNLSKWQFVNTTFIEPGNFLTVFASGKNKINYAAVWKTVITYGDTWKYILGDSEPDVTWKDLNFDDSNWDSGDSGFGYGDDDDQTVLPDGTISVYLRKQFFIEDLNDVAMLLLHMDYDDGFVAYINGIEIARANLGTANEFVPHNMLAGEPIEPLMIQNKLPQKFIVNNLNNILVEGNNVLSIQIHNADSTSSDLSAIPFLTVGYKTKKGRSNDVADIISHNLENLHTNFKIASTGESIYLSNPEQIIVDSIPAISLQPNLSYGRKPDGANDFYIFENSTPNSSNTTEGFKEIVDDPIFSLTKRVFNSPQQLTFLNTGGSNIKIYYTTNGEMPDTTKNLYSSPIEINNTTVIRAKAYSQNYLPSKTVSQTFLINENTDLPIVSLITDPYNFWDPDSGIYTIGRDTTLEYPFFDANFWQNWERPIHVEFLDKNGNLQLEQDAGVKIYGQWSRANAQKSLALHARKRYGENYFNYKFFDNVDLNKFGALVLRNSGNDWEKTMLRDGFMQSFADEVGIDRLAFRPSIVFINGKYWGIHNLREKINKTYIATHHNIDKNNIDLLEGNEEVVAGDDEDYKQLRMFINDEDLSIDENYEYVKSQMDIDNFINYNLIEIFIANTDWPSNNIKYWKEKNSDSKWRWILYDTDFGFQYADTNNYAHNTLEFALEKDGPNWPNPSWATLFLRKLIENENFKNKFVNHFADFRNTIFKTETVKNKITKYKTKIKNEIKKHIERWHTFTYSRWEQNIGTLYLFADKRLAYLTGYFINKFHLAELEKININISEKKAGTIELNSLKINYFPWEGKYFSNIPITLKAVAKPGYKFIKWEGDVETKNAEISVTISEAKTITAVFEKVGNYKNDIVINEINYDSSPDFDTEDWIELYNNSENDVDVSGWIFKDKDNDHKFVLPEGTVLQENNYLVLCRDTTAFINLFKTQDGYKSINYIGNFNFKLSSKGELIRLYNKSNELVDSLTYDDKSPWPVEAKGNGPTLELLNPSLDNSIAANWGISNNHGTPGRQNNSFIVSIKGKNKKSLTKFELKQNYPNPFNPTTTIKYQIPNVTSGFSLREVTLKIYDVLGKEVATLVNKKQLPGIYQVAFNGSKLASGIYYYRLKSGNYIETKKMILLK